MTTINVMFVCLGNICRSPLAEVVLRHKVKESGLTHHINVKSSGTAAYHVGHDADPRTIEIATKHGVQIDHTAQQFKPDFFREYTYILAMDDSNYLDIMNMYKGETGVNIHKFRKYDNHSSEMDVIDPYYGGVDGFQEVYNVVSECSTNFLQHLKEEYDLK